MSALGCMKHTAVRWRPVVYRRPLLRPPSAASNATGSWRTDGSMLAYETHLYGLSYRPSRMRRSLSSAAPDCPRKGGAGQYATRWCAGEKPPGLGDGAGEDGASSARTGSPFFKLLFHLS